MKNEKQLVETEILEVAKAFDTQQNIGGIAFAEFGSPTTNPWTDAQKAKDKKYTHEEYLKTLSLVRFFYKTEPVVSTVINKLVEIGINDLVFSRNKLSDNEFRIYLALKSKLLEFSEQIAQEYLLSGLIIPEVGWAKNKDKQFIFSLGIKKYASLVLPDTLTLRDPASIKIYTNWLGDKPSYFMKIPEEFIKFITTGGRLPNGTIDKDLFNKTKEQFPEFVKKVLAGEKEVQIFNDNILRRKYMADNPYPISYIAPSLDALQHKRKLRRMDYTLIDKVISAILHVKVGDKDFPITQTPEDQAYVNSLREQLRMRGNSDQLMERVFQLITNHTVSMEWIFPNVEILLNEKKYEDINQEILFGLGFPRTLITGEAAKTGTSDPEIATLAPVKTMENIRRKIIEIIRDICLDVAMKNNLKGVPTVEFAKLNLQSFADFVSGIEKLYNASAFSRTDFARMFGYDFLDQLEKLDAENKELTKRGLPTVGLSPFSSPALKQGGEAPNGKENPENTPAKEPKAGKAVENGKES